MDGYNDANHNDDHLNDALLNDEPNDIEHLGELDGRDEDEEKLLSDNSERNMSIRELLLRKRTNATSQIAIIGANVSAIESLDYEIVENELFKQDWRSRKKTQIFLYIFMKWALVLLIGATTGLVGFFSNIAVENIVGFKLLLTGNLMVEGK